MAVFLLPLSFSAVFMAVYLQTPRDPAMPRFRISWMTAHLLLALLLTVSTECLSALRLIRFEAVFSLWLSVISIAGIIILKNRQNGFPDFRPKINVASLRLFDLALIVFLTAVALILAFQGIGKGICADGENHHLPRIIHWIQNHHVGFYPTHNVRELHVFPGSHFLLLHYILLGGSYFFIHLLSWFHMVGLLIAVSLIARHLGADKRGQLLAAILTVTLPGILIQTGTIETGLPAAMWLCYFVFFVFRWGEKASPKTLMAAAGALGLAGFVKLTAFIFAAPFFVWFVYFAWKNNATRFWRPILLVFIFILCIHAPHWKRNLDLFRHPQGKTEFFSRQINRTMSPALLISNAIRNLGLELTLPWESARHLCEDLIRRTHRMLRISEEDLRLTTDITSKFLYFARDRDRLSAYNHLFFFLIASCFFFAGGSQRRGKHLFAYWMALGTAFLIFSCIHNFTLQNRRYLLPLLVLMPPWIGAVYSGISSRSFRAQWCWLPPAVLLLITTCLRLTPLAIPLLKTSSGGREPYQEAARWIKSRELDDIGIVQTFKDRTFPLIRALQEQKIPFRLEHVCVKNPSGGIPFSSDFHPEVIAMIHNHGATKGTSLPAISYAHQTYLPAWNSSVVTLYLAGDPGPPPEKRT